MTKRARFSLNLLAKIVQPRVAAFLVLTGVTAGLYGCAAGKGQANAAPAKPGAAGVAGAPAAERRYRVTADETSFYRFGPQQPSGPDLSLKKGTNVFLVKRSFGYSQVKTIDSQQVGFVSTEDIAPLTQQELAALAAAAAPSSSAPVESVAGPGKKSRAIVGEYTLPPAGSAEQERLPESASTPTPPPNNLFRY